MLLNRLDDTMKKPLESLNKSFLKISPVRSEIDRTRDELENISNNFDYKYVLALLNSKLYLYLLNILRTTESFDINPSILGRLPLPYNNDVLINEIISLVDQILDLKKQDPTTNTEHLEKEIDQLVYELYDLTDDEIKIVEESVK